MKQYNPRVALLGGTGFAGRNVRDALEQAGITVGVFSRTTGCDLSQLSSAWADLDEFRPTHLVNCAALVGSVNYVSDFAAGHPTRSQSWENESEKACLHCNSVRLPRNSLRLWQAVHARGPDPGPNRHVSPRAGAGAFASRCLLHIQG